MPPLWLLCCLVATTSPPAIASAVMFTIQNWDDLHYLYVVDPPSEYEDAEVYASHKSHILGHESIQNMLFSIDWNDAGFAKITCVANNMSLTASPAPVLERYSRATVVASSVVRDASFWALGSITWDSDELETMFIINHLYSDFLISQEDEHGQWGPDLVMTTRFPKHFSMKRARWVVQIAGNEMEGWPDS